MFHPLRPHTESVLPSSPGSPGMSVGSTATGEPQSHPWSARTTYGPEGRRFTIGILDVMRALQSGIGHAFRALVDLLPGLCLFPVLTLRIALRSRRRKSVPPQAARPVSGMEIEATSTRRFNPLAQELEMKLNLLIAMAGAAVTIQAGHVESGRNEDGGCVL